MTPASVSSLDASSQQPQSNASATNLEPKMEVKHQEEEEESDAGSCSKGGKLSNHKTEEQPFKSEVKKEEGSGDGGKAVPMETSTAGVKIEDKKPEVKKEVKEEETSEATVPQAPVKKKSKELSFIFTFFFYCIVSMSGNPLLI